MFRSLPLPNSRNLASIQCLDLNCQICQITSCKAINGVKSRQLSQSPYLCIIYRSTDPYISGCEACTNRLTLHKNPVIVVQPLTHDRVSLNSRSKDVHAGASYSRDFIVNPREDEIESLPPYLVQEIMHLHRNYE